MTRRRSLTTRQRVEPGVQFGRLTVLSEAERRSGSNRRWHCQCECGQRTIVFGSNLNRGHSLSCGCLARDSIRKHGLSKSKEYKAWINMRTRCENRNAPTWEDYGGRGIRICKRWETFENFLADMGPRPGPRYSVDRIDVNGNYEPQNCRWATDRTQSRNKRNQRYVTVDGQRMTLIEAAEKSNLKYNTILYRLRRGWSLRDALTREEKRGVRP